MSATTYYIHTRKPGRKKDQVLTRTQSLAHAESIQEQQAKAGVTCYVVDQTGRLVIDASGTMY